MLHSILVPWEDTELFSPSWYRPQTVFKIVGPALGLHDEVALIPLLEEKKQKARQVTTSHVGFGCSLMAG